MTKYVFIVKEQIEGKWEVRIVITDEGSEKTLDQKTFTFDSEPQVEHIDFT